MIDTGGHNNNPNQENSTNDPEGENCIPTLACMMH